MSPEPSLLSKARLTLYRYPGTSSGLSVSSSGQSLIQVAQVERLGSVSFVGHSLIQIAAARDYGPYR